MLRQRQRGRARRTETGSSVAEFAPAMWLLIVVIFFPLLDLMAMGVKYGCVIVLNYNQTHEASLIASGTNTGQADDPSGPIKKIIPTQWLTMGFGKFCGVVGPIQTDIYYRAGTSASDGVTNVTDKVVRVQTTLTCYPLLTIPMPVVNVPGLNAPMQFTVGSEKMMENPDNAP